MTLLTVSICSPEHRVHFIIINGVPARRYHIRKLFPGYSAITVFVELSKLYT